MGIDEPLIGVEYFEKRKKKEELTTQGNSVLGLPLVSPLIRSKVSSLCITRRNLRFLGTDYSVQKLCALIFKCAYIFTCWNCAYDVLLKALLKIFNLIYNTLYENSTNIHVIQPKSNALSFSS